MVDLLPKDSLPVILKLGTLISPEYIITLDCDVCVCA